MPMEGIQLGSSGWMWGWGVSLLLEDAGLQDPVLRAGSAVGAQGRRAGAGHAPWGGRLGSAAPSVWERLLLRGAADACL